MISGPPIVTLTPNPAVDISVSVEKLIASSKLRCDGVRYDPGGGGINVARVLCRFGADVVALFPAGGPTGDLLLRLLKQEDVPVIAVPEAAYTRQDFTVLERRSGAQYRFVLPGPQLTESELRALVVALQGIRPAPEYIVASGSLPLGAPVSFYRLVAEVASEMGAKLALDTSRDALVAAVDAPVYLVKPNLHELQAFGAAALDTDEQRLRAVRHILREKPVQMIALTLGADGALLATRDRAWRGKAPALEPRGSVGAGDSFLAGLIWKLSCGVSHVEALRFAIAAGSASLSTSGTELCRTTDIQQLLPEVEVISLD